MRSRVLKAGAAMALSGTGLDRLLGALSGSTSTPLVVGYHRVVEDLAASAGESLPLIALSRRMLERQLDWIGLRFRFVSLDELGQRLASGERAGHLAAVTFDDGYSDVYTDVFPLLKRKGIPAAVFVVTDLVGTSRLQIYDKLYIALVHAFARWRSVSRDLSDVLLRIGVSAPRIEYVRGPFEAMEALVTSLPQAPLRQLTETLAEELDIDERTIQWPRSVTWEMLAEMHRAGVTIGSHTRSHALLTNESRQSVLDETTGSREELTRRLGITVRHFAYPDGRFDREVVSAVAASGYRFAYTSCRHRDPNHPLLTIPRRMLGEGSCLDIQGRFSPAVMACLTNAVFDLVGGCRQDHGHRNAGWRTGYGSRPAHSDVAAGTR